MHRICRNDAIDTNKTNTDQNKTNQHCCQLAKIKYFLLFLS